MASSTFRPRCTTSWDGGLPLVRRALTDGTGHPTLDRRSTLSTRWTMERRLGALAALFLALLVPGCGGRNVLLPPRLDLRPYAKLGLVTFSVENARGSLQRYATEQFAEQVLAAQPGIELLELGSVDTLLQRMGEQDLGPA